MRTLAIFGLAALCAFGACAQGIVTFMAYAPGAVDAQVYGPDPYNPTVEEQGDTVLQNEVAGNSTVGSVTYGGSPIGGASWTGATPVSFAAAGAQVYTYGNLFTAELYALSTTTSQAIPPGTTLASLSPVPQYQSTFATSSTPFGAGYFNQALPVNDPGIPGTGYIGPGGKAAQGPAFLGNNAVAAVVAWFNGGGQFTTFASAQASGVPTGFSAIFEINNLIEPSSVMTQDNDGAPSLGQLGTAYLEGLSDGTPTSYTSFELPGIFPIPEPGTMALGVMGACAFLARRRNFLTGVFGGFQMRCKAVFPVMESLIRILATDAQKR